MAQKNLPLITIITVVLNSEKNIEQTILSVLKQPYHNIEYIVIDGGSTDNTINIIKKYDDKILYWLSEPDKGIYDAMNKGWNAASEDGFIMFLGSGDELISLPNNEDYLHKKWAIFGKVYLGNNKPMKVTADFRLKLGNTLHHQALLVPKQFHIGPPFDTRYKIYADFDFNQRLLKQGVTFKYCDEFVSYADPCGISNRIKIREMLKIVKKNFGLSWALLAVFYYILQGIKYDFRKFSLAR